MKKALSTLLFMFAYVWGMYAQQVDANQLETFQSVYVNTEKTELDGVLEKLFQSVFHYASSPLKFEQKYYRAGDMTSMTDPTRGGKVNGNVKGGSLYITIKVTNPDYCGYTIWAKRGKVEVECGEQEFADKTFTPDAKRTLYRGIVPNKKFKEDAALYVLPCSAADGEAVLSVVHDIDVSNKKMHILSFRRQPVNDTVYAMRGGVVCLMPKNIQNSILVKHTDETFAFYALMSMPLVKPGDKIVAGQAIGICETDIHTAFFYLDKEKINSKEEPSGCMYCSFIPTLYTQSGQTRISEHNASLLMSTAIPIDIITQDMSGSEKKKYLKTH